MTQMFNTPLSVANRGKIMNEARYLELESAYHRLIPPAARPAIAHGLFRGQAQDRERQFREQNFANEEEFMEFRTEYRRRHYPRRERRGWLQLLGSKVVAGFGFAAAFLIVPAILEITGLGDFLRSVGFDPATVSLKAAVIWGIVLGVIFG